MQDKTHDFQFISTEWPIMIINLFGFNGLYIFYFGITYCTQLGLGHVFAAYSRS